MRLLRGLAAGLVLAAAQPTIAAPAAEIVTLQGRGDYRDAAAGDWRPARVKLVLEAGQYVRTTEAQSKMGLLLADQTQMTLQGVSIVQVKTPETAGPRRSIIEFNKGTGRIQTKTPTKELRVGTPTGLAAIRGTEWVIEVDDDGRSAFTVVDGEIELSNELGAISVGVDEQGVLERGKPPAKRRVQNARERVQWVNSLVLDPARYGPGEADRVLAAAEEDLYFGRASSALQRLEAGAARHPFDARFPALQARAALMADDFARARAAAAEGLRTFPDSVEVLLAAGEVARLDGDSAGARRALRRATQVAPGDWRAWHALGQVQSERAHPRAARRALAEADRLAPGNATVLGELSLVESNAFDLPRARELADRALAAQPEDFASWTAAGYARLKSGDPAGAVDALLRATMLEPGYAKAHVYLAVAYWQQGRAGDALATLRTASVHDPKDPLPYQLAAMIQSDLLRPGDALASARESVARLAFVKSLDAIANNLRGGANLGAPLAQLGLEAWAMKNAQDSFDPLWAGSHLFLADRLPGKFLGNSELIQGFLIDPLAFGASNRFQALVSRPGAYGTAALRLSGSSDASLVETLLNLNGLAFEGQFAYFLEATRLRAWTDDGSARDRGTSFTLGLGARLTDAFGIFFYANRLVPQFRAGEGNEVFESFQRTDGKTHRIDAGAHWRPSPDWQVWLKGGHGAEDTDRHERAASQVAIARVLRDQDFATAPRRSDLGIRALRRFAGGLECHATLEGAWTKVEDFFARDFFARTSPTAARSIETVRQEIRDDSRTAAFGARWPVARGILVEAHVDRTTYEKTNAIVVRRDFINQRVEVADDHDRGQWSPRAGVVLHPLASLTVRAAYQKWLRPASRASLTPSSTAGIPLDERYMLDGGRLERARGQLEWQPWPALLVTAFADRQEIDNLFSPLVGVLNNRPDSSNLERLRNRSFNALASLEAYEGFAVLARGELREAGLAVNALPMRQLSVFAEGVRATGENTGTEHAGKRLPFLPRDRYAIGATFFSDQRWNVAVKGTYRSERFADEGNLLRLAGGWSGAAQAYWETHDKRFSVDLVVVNIGAKAAGEAFGLALNLRF